MKVKIQGRSRRVKIVVSKTYERKGRLVYMPIAGIPSGLAKEVGRQNSKQTGAVHPRHITDKRLDRIIEQAEKQAKPSIFKRLTKQLFGGREK